MRTIFIFKMAAICLCLVRAFLQIRNVCLGLCGWPYHWWYSYSVYHGLSVWWYSRCTLIAILEHLDTYRRSTRSYLFTLKTGFTFCRVSWDSYWQAYSTVDSGKSILFVLVLVITTYHISHYVSNNGTLIYSILVSNLNSISTVAWEDFVSQIPIFKGASEKNQLWCIKSISKS